MGKRILEEGLKQYEVNAMAKKDKDKDKAAEKTPDEIPAEGEEEVEEAAAEEAPVEAEDEEEIEEEEEEEEEGEQLSALEKVTMLTDELVRSDHPDFRPGDTVKVHVKIVEGNKERIQVFEGVVIALKHGGMDRTFTVRKTSWGVGVERTFFLNSPKVDKIQVVRRGRVRRAKLYYLRQRAGKAARIKERRQTQG